MNLINLTVNGREHNVVLKGTETLLDVLRQQLQVTGPKRGCDTGDCGACAVLLDGKLVNACLVLAFTANGKEVVTAEGLGTPDKLHPIQQSFYQYYAAQCGFCTPGMVMAAKALLDENPNPTVDEVKHYLAGQLCRCTGYVKIIEAILEAARSRQTAAS